jgi:uncharacterized iron-regulated protein
MKNTTDSHQQPSGHSAVAKGRVVPLRMAASFASLVAAAVAVSMAPARSGPLQGGSAACETYGRWIDLKTGLSIDRGELFGDLVAKRAVVLLGESHNDVDHHLWQLHTMAALHGRGGNLVVGFEAFPRRLQPVLDDWIGGKLTDEAFLKASEWRRVWNFDSALYMPLFQFARLNRIPMIALNVERSLVAQVSQNGWEGVPTSEREGLSNPASASPPYQRELARVFVIKKSLPPDAADRMFDLKALNIPEPDEAALAQAQMQPEFKRFVEAQLTWDRAMAEALANAKRKFPNATVVGILGSGHVEEGYGVPHQLRDLGVAELKTLIPVSVEDACAHVGASYADAVFTLPRTDEAPPPERPRLGVLLARGDGAPHIQGVARDSVGEIAGLKTGDFVVRAAGLEMRNSDDLVEIVGRQAPGTWLPLSIRRDGQEIDLIAKFPTRPTQGR